MDQDSVIVIFALCSKVQCLGIATSLVYSFLSIMAIVTLVKQWGYMGYVTELWNYLTLAIDLAFNKGGFEGGLLSLLG